MESKRPHPPPDTPKKFVIFCNECDYNAPIEQWDEHHENGTRIISCPDCNTVVERRKKNFETTAPVCSD